VELRTTTTMSMSGSRAGGVPTGPGPRPATASVHNHTIPFCVIGALHKSYTWPSILKPVNKDSLELDSILLTVVTDPDGWKTATIQEEFKCKPIIAFDLDISKQGSLIEMNRLQVDAVRSAEGNDVLLSKLKSMLEQRRLETLKVVTLQQRSIKAADLNQKLESFNAEEPKITRSPFGLSFLSGKGFTFRFPQSLTFDAQLDQQLQLLGGLNVTTMTTLAYVYIANNTDMVDLRDHRAGRYARRINVITDPKNIRTDLSPVGYNLKDPAQALAFAFKIVFQLQITGPFGGPEDLHA